MKAFLSKAIIIFLVSTFYFLFSATYIFAQSNLNTNPDIENNPHNSTQTTIIEIMSAITCQLTGIDPVKPSQGCIGIVNQAEGKLGFLPKTEEGGAIGVMGNLITMLYTPPVRTADYFENLAQNFGIAKPAIAQQTGTGFEGLRPLLGLWTAFRNIVYLVFVIAFIVIGLAIMLRIKIDPRTVMTIQNQIPKIIIGILLVTFSYAISGFLIDLMYVTIHITGNVIASGDTKMNASITNNVATASNPFRAIGATMEKNSIIALPNLAWKPAEAISEPIADLFDNPPGRVIMGVVGGFLGSKLRTGTATTVSGFVGIGQKIIGIGGMVFPPLRVLDSGLTILGNIAKGIGGTGALASNLPGTPGFSPTTKLVADATGGIIGAVVGIAAAKKIASLILSLVVFLIIIIALLFALFRLWFTLLMAYVMILIDVVLAPFWIIGGIIPGSPINISGWLRSIVANLAAFPVVIAMFLLGKVFMNAFSAGSNNFVPPLIGNRLDFEAIGALIGLGIILMTPNVVTLLKTALKAPKIDTGGIAKGLGAGVGLPISTGKGIGSIILGGREAIVNPDTGRWEKRTTSRAFLGRIFGR